VGWPLTLAEALALLVRADAARHRKRQIRIKFNLLRNGLIVGLTVSLGSNPARATSFLEETLARTAP
jgi:hypothetical protein